MASIQNCIFEYDVPIEVLLVIEDAMSYRLEAQLLVSKVETINSRFGTQLTNCSRGIRNAWHFHYALVLVFKVVCGGFGIALLTP